MPVQQATENHTRMYTERIWTPVSNFYLTKIGAEKQKDVLVGVKMTPISIGMVSTDSID